MGVDMRPSVRLAICLVLSLVLCTISVNAAAPTPVKEGNGAIFGGAMLNANSSGANETPFEQLPAIVEDYTATWCDNCVYVEEALHHVSDDTGALVMHFHRNNDTEDPFGIPEGESWWQRRNNDGVAPPTIAVNGINIQEGSVPNGNNLEEDYTNLVAIKPDIGSGDSQFIWHLASDNSSGAFIWSLQPNWEHGDFASAASVNNYLFIIEETSTFNEGSNGIEDYPNVIKEIIDLGTESEGMVNITLPDAWDGNDLQLVLIHEFILLEEVDEVKEEGSDGFLPSITMLSTSLVALIAAMSRKNYSTK
ncbi:MAG: hypothetical protein HOE92_06815 [Euryarchaeota archaeon]|jgi:hypothetical protein|nr:hypothetical protein [Euryarchaeota archaeon]MBT3971912.1 hypothetical protein [Euryarchaeota archaeon]